MDSDGVLRTLTVVDGYGDGRYAAGATVPVWSAVDPQAAIVTGWSAALTDPGEWNSTLVMPDADLTVTPTTEGVDLPLVEETLSLPSGPRAILGVIPASPVALVLFFHGAAYSRAELRDNAAASLARRMVRAGYAVIAIESTVGMSAGSGGWNAGTTEATNPDLVAVREALDALRAAGRIPASLPVVAWGMSSGGMFAHTVGLALPVDAVAAWCAPGASSTLAATHARTAWFLAERDSTFPTGATDAATYADDLTSRGVDNLVYVHPATPLYAERFTRVTGIDAERSAAIAADLRAASAVDDAGAWLVSGAQATAGLSLPSLSGLTTAQVTAVAAEIEIMAADHELYDDAGARMMDFLVGG